MLKRTPWQKIRDAASKGTGLRLTPEECQQLSMDSALMTRADLDDEPEEPCHRSGCVCADCSGADLTADND